MKIRCLFFVFTILAVSVSARAQVRTITNADLEKYKKERLKAEREYRENYARLGLPSPEELERRRERSRAETEKLATRLRAERLERERVEAQRLAYEQFAASLVIAVRQSNDPYYDEPYFGGYYYARRPRPTGRGVYQQPGYFAGGQFWPTPVRTYTPPAVWIRPRH